MSRVIDPFDELAQLFLTDEEDEAQQERARNAHDDDNEDTDRVPVELLLVGHLPVRADLWLRPYAETLARRVGSAALVRLDSDEPSVEVLGGDTETALPEDAERSLRHTLAFVASNIDLWIVRPSSQATPASIVQAGANRITIISSADEAALVAAYQRIKELADAAGEVGIELPTLGIAILGSADSVARSMVDRLNRTTRTFLGIELPLVATLQQMEAGSRAQAYARFLGERSPQVEDVVMWLGEFATEPRPTIETPVAPPAAAPTPHIEAPHVEDEPIVEDITTADHEDHVDEAEVVPGDRDVIALLRHSMPEEPAPHVERLAEAAPPAREPSETQRITTWRAGESVKMAPKPAMLQEPKSPAQIKEPVTDNAARPLTPYVAGLTPIAVRCPGHERVELAIDAAGCFHLLCKEDAMRELHLVEAWTRSHRELLAMALPSFTLAPGTAPTAHVFTEAPVTLADLHGSTLHLHVLAPVVVEGKQGWYAAPLNNPQ